jgi:pectinesterase
MNLLRKAALITLSIILWQGVQAQQRLVVAQDGSGKYRTVQEAINAVPDGSPLEVVIYIKKGVYKEKLTIPQSKSHITFKGEDKMSTILTYDDYASKKDSSGNNIGTSGSASIHIYGSDFSAVNITFENSSGPVGQAVAVWAGGDHTSFINCRFFGFQDTLYTFGTGTFQLYKDCYIEGTVDFIFGSATAWFENCRIFCKKAGYVTAASTPENVTYGYVFYKCDVTGDALPSSYFLGRPWRPYAKTVFIKCKLGEHIKPQGWDNWSKPDNEKTAFYAEYENTGPGSNTGKRVSWSHVLTSEEASRYTKENVVGKWAK